MAQAHNKLEALNQLLDKADVWVGNQQEQAYPAVTSGFTELDAELPGGGWPRGALTEIMTDQEGIGELQLLMPALARMSQEGRWVALIAPPYVPYAPALAIHGIDLSHVLVIRPKTNQQDSLWAVEQALRAGTCGAVISWSRDISDKQLRRLQLAAEEGDAMGVLFRPVQCAKQSSPAALRLQLKSLYSHLSVHILKRRGGWPTGPLAINLKAAMPDVSRSLYAGASPAVKLM